VEAKDKNGLTALMWAAWEGHASACRVLLDQGKAHIEACDTDGKTGA
jgi:ankyrin repeat protein